MAHPSAQPYVGRFAPSPTGDLHFGSLLAAVASYLQSRKSAGKWLLRIEDIDPPRELAGSAEGIVRDLERFSLVPDEPVLFQSSRNPAYQQACEKLIESGRAYWCGCSRADLPATGIYPGTCRRGIPRGKKPRAIRIRTEDEPIRFYDGLQGIQLENLQTSAGDFVIRRADGLYAYQLAVVVDDAFQRITEIVRGADLLDSTARQIWLQNCLDLATPHYLHIPVATLPNGRKLSKSNRSDPVRQQTPAEALRQALSFLGHDAPTLSLAETWNWALEHWNLERLPRMRSAPISANLR